MTSICMKALLLVCALVPAGTSLPVGAAPGRAPMQGSTALSRKVDAIGMGTTRSAVIAAIGAPSSVIMPGKLKANGIDRGSEIEYVLAWDNPGCSRVEIFFNARHQVTGSDAGKMCAHPMKKLPPSYDCSATANAKFCR